MKHILGFFLFTFLTFALFASSAHAQRNGWEFTSWDMKLKQVQDSLHERQITYNYAINDSKGGFLKISIADYQSWATDLFFALESQFLYQVTSKRKFNNKDAQVAAQTFEQLIDNFRETYGAPVKETEDLTAPFCQFEYIWELEHTKIVATYCKTSSVSLTLVYQKR
jgi:hypothetical protein